MISQLDVTGEYLVVKESVRKVLARLETRNLFNNRFKRVVAKGLITL